MLLSLTWQPKISGVTCPCAKIDTVKALLCLSQQDIIVGDVHVC